MRKILLNMIEEIYDFVGTFNDYFFYMMSFKLKNISEMDEEMNNSVGAFSDYFFCVYSFASDH